MKTTLQRWGNSQGVRIRKAIIESLGMEIGAEVSIGETPFHVPVPPGSGLSGYVMREQLKAIDYQARGMRKVGDATREFLHEVLSVIDACMFPKPESDSRD